MQWLRSRLFVLSAMLALGVGIAALSQQGEFGYLELRSPDGSLTRLHGSLQTVVHTAENLLIAFDDGPVHVEIELPATAQAGQLMDVPVRVGRGEEVRTSLLHFQVNETGTFVGGRLAGKTSEYDFEGGLRIRGPRS